MSDRTPHSCSAGRKEEDRASTYVGPGKVAGVKNRLSAKDVRWILAQEMKASLPTNPALKRSEQELVSWLGRRRRSSYGSTS